MGKRTVPVPSSVIYDTGKMVLEPRGICVEFRYRTCMGSESVVYFRGFEDIFTAELAIQQLARKELVTDAGKKELERKLTYV